MSVPASELGTVGSSSPTSVVTPVTSTPLTSSQIVAAGVAKGGGWFGSGGLPSVLSGLPNIALIAVGAILVVGALLISQKQIVIPAAARVAA